MVSLLRTCGRAPLFSVVLAAACLTGCDSGGDGGEGGSTSGTPGSTSDVSSSTTAGTGSSTGADPSSSTTDDSTSTTGDAESSTGADASSSTGSMCTPGTQNCPCDGDACEGELQCIKGTCYDPSGCQGEQQDTEPNEDEANAQDLGSVTCGALNEVDGSSEPGDVDVFSLSVDDLGDKCPASDGTIAIATTAEPVQVCMYFSCNAGAASVNCGADTDATSDSGLPGCCGTNSVEPDFFCSGVNNDSEVFLSVGGLEANMCVDYALAYRVL
jgi:hypothetical protein